MERRSKPAVANSSLGLGDSELHVLLQISRNVGQDEFEVNPTYKKDCSLDVRDHSLVCKISEKWMVRP